ncbi:uncharacterized protein LOC116209609 isoform X2 [Punica granatum]|uniref:Uncharacterized protein LOC116209609 isoform X2 n=1 Tax=Punica granatum TaxID=22663 RepID=A0A6P8DTF1_PUNGR|nr:uncharacterized protein LOC116209609 isoform X2 [Punica granatum]
MGSLGNGNDNGEKGPEIQESFNLSNAGETQLLDSRLSPSSLPANDEMEEDDPVDEHFLESTMPYDDTVPVDGEFETQIVNLYEETQAVNFDAETQVINSQEDRMDNLETQLLDEFATQVVTDDESEETCGTEVLGAEDDSTDDESVRKSSGDSTDKKNMQFSSPGEKGKSRQKANNLMDELCGQGSPPRGFTSIRTASVRASGLAARSASTNQSDSRSFNLLSSGQSSAETSKMNGLSRVTVSSNSLEEVDQEQLAGKLDDKVEEPGDKNKCRVGSSAVRRLFTEDVDLEMNSNSSDNAEEELNIAGLSYNDSQEPGDVSQANALDFVDRFLKDNLDDLHQDFGVKKTGVVKSASVLNARGTQLLAANRAATKVTGIFDWDDNMEDEGGGDIFCRRKDDFFNGESMQKSRTQPWKKAQRSRLDERKLSNEPSGPQDKIRGLVCSAPAVKFNTRGEIRKKTKVDDACARNLKDEFIAEVTGKCLSGNYEEVCTVGFDTQVAAEAMEALCHDEGLIEKGGRKDKELQNVVENGRKKGPELPSKCPRRFKRTDGSDAKKSSISLRRSSRNITKHQQTAKVKLREQTSDLTNTHELDISCGSREVKNGMLEEKLEEVSKVGDSFTPVARRTRLSKVAKEGPRAEKLSNLPRETNGAAEIDAHKLRDVPSRPPARPEGGGEPVPRRKRSWDQGTRASSGAKRKALATKWNLGVEGLTEQKSAEDPSTTAERNPSLSKSVEAEAKVDESPRERSKVSNMTCITPTSRSTPSNDLSPVCVGNEYFKHSCKNLSRSSLWKELKSLTASSGLEPSHASKETRRRWRDMADVRVLFSHHLDDDTIKQQKKILTRLGASEASSISDATHFVTDKFVRTRNMLEAVALSKPVVTHLWLEGCGQAGCFLDEKSYVLRDAKKEKEIGFTMPVSLSRASQYPLLRTGPVRAAARGMRNCWFMLAPFSETEDCGFQPVSLSLHCGVYFLE